MTLENSIFSSIASISGFTYPLEDTFSKKVLSNEYLFPANLQFYTAIIDLILISVITQILYFSFNIKLEFISFLQKIKNISNLFTDNLNDININLNNLYKKEGLERDKGKKYMKTTKNSKEKINNKKYQYNNIKEAKLESFCYFKLFEGNNFIKKYNPLKVCSLNPEYYGYYECYISIDFNSGCLNMSSKIPLDKINSIFLNNKKIISIKLKDINSIKLEKYTKDIMKIQNILLKYDIKTNNSFKYIIKEKYNIIYWINYPLLSKSSEKDVYKKNNLFKSIINKNAIKKIYWY